MPLRYPLDLRFKLIAIASQIEVRDASGQTLVYVKQKLFKLREAVTAYGDSSQRTALYRIAADRVIDWSAKYMIEGADGTLLGSVRREGMRSLWRARYQVADGRGAERFQIHEASALVRILDGIFGEIPILGALSGFLFHPTYLVTRAADGVDVMQVTKQPALFEGRFRMEPLGAVEDRDEELILLAVLMMVLLERNRG